MTNQKVIMESASSKKSGSPYSSIDKKNDKSDNNTQEHVVEDFSIEYKRDVYDRFDIYYKV